MTYQSFEEWQKSPIQGAIPLPPNIQDQLDQRCPCFAKTLAECACETAGNPELAEVGESLKSVLPGLEKAYSLMNGNLAKRYPDLYMAVCDALNAGCDALERLGDEPEMPEI